MTKSVIDWVPRLNPLLRVGPPRWNGTAIVTDIGIDSEERLIEIGLAERCVLDEVDGSRDVSTIASELSAKGMPVDTTRIVGVLNRFAYVGAVERPFSMKAGLADIDWAANEGQRVRPDQIAGAADSGAGLGLWRKLTFLAHPVVFGILVVAGIAGAAFLAINLSDALATVLDATVWQAILAGVAAVVWTGAVTMLHESGHGALFHHESTRSPFLALTRFGLILMPNTHMPGFSLLGARERARVLAAGPLVSMVFAALPVVLFVTVDEPQVRIIAAMCMCFDALIIALGISPFPNTDATRLIEAWVGVDQLQAVAFRTLVGKYSLPAGLPLRSKVAIRLYPVLLLVTIALWLAVIVWAARLILN